MDTALYVKNGRTVYSTKRNKLLKAVTPSLSAIKIHLATERLIISKIKMYRPKPLEVRINGADFDEIAKTIKGHSGTEDIRMYASPQSIVPIVKIIRVSP